VFLESENVAPRNGHAGFVLQRLRPGRIVVAVALAIRELGNCTSIN
jgi:hypothetical protein